MPFTSKEISKHRPTPSNRALTQTPRWHQPVLDFGSAELTPPADSVEVSRDTVPRARSQSTLFDFLDVNEKSESDIQYSRSSRGMDPEATNLPHDVERSDLANCPKPKSVALSSGEKAKARDILTAIRVLSTIETAGRSATDEERDMLLRFSGFGPVALSIFPDPVKGNYKDAAWKAFGEELKSLLTPSDYASAKRTTFNAFYTSTAVIQAMHRAIARLGVPASATALEPGCGIGNFMTFAPQGMRFIGVELDNISGRIAKVLHPNQDIRIENFRDTNLREDSLDAVLGNVPFADLKMEYRGQKFSLHDFFFAKGIDALRPGGILALISSRFTLDKQNGAIREYLAERADFVGAIRLPSDAFKREGTEVVTDIVFLRKRESGAAQCHVEPEWLTVDSISVEGSDVAVNLYFKKFPDMILGTITRRDTLYGEGFSVQGDGDFEAKLRKAISRLPEYGTLKAPGEAKPSFIPLARSPPHQNLSDGSFVVTEGGTIALLIEGRLEPVIYGGRRLDANGAMTGKRLATLIRLRALARLVLQSQNDGWALTDRDEARRELNVAYDRFVNLYGPINKTTFGETADGGTIRRMPNLVKFKEDPDAMLVMSLEEYDEATGKATKSAIMTKDVVGKTPPVTRVNSAEEGLLVSLNQRGVVDLPFISELYGKSRKDVISELSDLIFPDPERKSWQTADAYLSGNVRKKLAAALHAGPVYARNVAALRNVQPEDVLPSEIDANLGAPWIPLSDIQAFAAHLFKVEPSSVPVAHLMKDAVWSLDADYAAQKSVAATSEYGTPRANGTWLLELALNMKTPVIYDPDPSDPDKRVVNHEETLAAREKQKLIKEGFRAWIFCDPERTERLVRIYNDTYNNLRPRLFDGSHLDFPGMSHAFTLRQHQKDAVWRGMSSGNTLLAHVVGAGKSAIMAATGIKMKQAGLIKKPMYVVPNHLLEQFAREFMHVYPNAKLLIAGKEDFTKDRRKFITAKIASGEWDGIIVTHSSFERIGMSRAYQERFLLDQIAEYDELLREHAAAKGSNRNLIKTIEKQKAARSERLKNLLAEDKKDDGLVFDELGADQLFIDEFQAYKNLEAPTKMERVAGIQSGGSERAFDMYMKSRYLHQQHAGHGLITATGTPISNSLCEMYTLQRYLDPEGLRDRGLEHFDAWAATFGEVVDTMEIAPDGKSLKPRSRFSRFVNLPELSQMFRTFADVQTAEMLKLPRPRLEGGKPIVVACPMSEIQHAFQVELVERYERLRSMKVDPRVDNALNITTDGRKLAIDARMLSATAPEFPGSKMDAMLARITDTWRKTEGKRLTQMVFCDIGVHPTPWGYSAYDEITRKLVAGGVPRDEIAAIGDADSEAKKQALFEKVRQGAVRILLGSTMKMGTGTNVQKRLIALHELDAPWKPAEVEQREGRILRQGNENEEVAIYRYVTEGSFDAYMWQALETKAGFIAQVMTGGNTARRAEDIGGQELSYAEVKAIASGNPAVLTLAEADAELQRLSLLKKRHLDEQFIARRSVRDLPETIANLSKRLADVLSDQETALFHKDAPVTVGEVICERDEAMAALGRRLNAVPYHSPTSRRFPLGMFRGLAFGLVVHPKCPPDIYLEGRAVRESGLSRDNQGPRAVLNALERLVKSYETDAARLRQDLAVAEAQLRDYRARIGATFPHEAALSALAALRSELKEALANPSARAEDDRPTVADIVSRFADLREKLHALPPS